jgi:hypothetical protein
VFADVAGAAGVAACVEDCVAAGVESSDDDRVAFAAGRVDAAWPAVVWDERPADAAAVRVGVPPRAR